MALDRTRFKGRVKIRGRPREQAHAEIMLMKHREAYEGRKRRRLFFTLLDIIAIIGFVGGVYSLYIGKFLNGFLLLLVGVIILSYFTIRNYLRKNRTSKK